MWKCREYIATKDWLSPGYYRDYAFSCLLLRLKVKILACGWAEWDGCRCYWQVCAVLQQ
jgi:hypothetical protein